jgi:uncharacterized protein with PIN domain
VKFIDSGNCFVCPECREALLQGVVEYGKPIPERVKVQHRYSLSCSNSEKEFWAEVKYVELEPVE